MARPYQEKIRSLLAAERGTVVKQAADVTVALAYPNTYHIGMSNLGLHSVYGALNRRDDTLCERVFLPDEEDRVNFKPGALASLEKGLPVRDFDILAFSVSFEQDYTHILEILRLSGIEPEKEARTADDPLLLLGGICSFFNPEPLADFFDLVVVGEGEEVLQELVEAYKTHRLRERGELLLELSRIPGVYVPGRYEIRYRQDGTIGERMPLGPAPVSIVKRTVNDFTRSAAATVIQTPNTEFSDMHLAEMTRGCGRHCRFCMAGYLYLPPRSLPLPEAVRQAETADSTCGKIGLVGAALSDYPEIGDLCSSIQGSLSVSSLRADSVSGELVSRLAKSGHKTIAIAPEAGSDRLRRVINKGVTEEEILQAADLIFGAGIPNLKLYFIVGLPTESQEDVAAILALALKVREVQLKYARPAGRIGRITLSVNSFVPKPFTPFQWEPMERVTSLQKKQRFLEKEIRKIGNMNLIHDQPKWEYVQAVLARGDRRVGKLIRRAHENGEDWKAAARDAGIEMDFYAARKRGFDETLPWDFVDIGVRKDYLRTEYDRALEGRFTPPCKVGSCRACGVCT